MLIIILSVVVVSTSSMHIWPCEPAIPGSCDQFLANGGGQGSGVDQSGFLNQGGNVGQSAGSLAFDPTFWTNTRLQHPNLLDPTQSVDPGLQLSGSTNQFVDPTLMLNPLLNGGIGPFDQSNAGFPPGLDFVGGKAGKPLPYTKGSNLKFSKDVYPKKSVLEGYPKEMSKAILSVFSKKNAIMGYPKGKLAVQSMYGNYPKMYYKKPMLNGLSKSTLMAAHNGYPTSFKMGYYGKTGGYSKFGKGQEFKKFQGGY